MKKNRNISLFRSITLLMLALGLIFMSAYGHAHSHKVKVSVENQAIDHCDDEKNSSKDFIIVQCEAVVPMVQMQVPVDLYFIFELFELDEAFTEEIFYTPSVINDYFKTLFSHIISPNAP